MKTRPHTPESHSTKEIGMKDLTTVELLWLEKRIENRIRFGRPVSENVVDRNRRVLSFTPGSILAFVRWTSNDFGTVLSRIDILRAAIPGQRYSTVPWITPGGESLLRLSGWPKVERVLQLIDGVPGLAPSPEGHVMSARCGTIFTTFAATILLLSTVGGATPHYIWNASNNVPIGLYRVQPATQLTVTELVAVQPPDLLAAFLDLNGYLPVGVPMLKRVLALSGQTVCRNGLTIAVDGIDVGEAHERDARGRPLPVWHGCRVIADGDVFVMNWQSADSLDGRYFGPLPASAVIGRAVAVWTGEE